MNLYGIIILGALVISYALDLAATILNLRTLDNPLPQEFREIYDPAAYRKSQDYTKTKSTFGIVTAAFNFALTLVFWFAHGFEWTDEIVRSWNLPPILSGLAYIGILLAARTILSLPFSIYSTFIIEQRFGFNTTTVKTFVLDLVKGLGLGILLGGPLIAGILWFLTYAGSFAWLYCWLAVTAFTLVMQYVAPIWIMPLFNKFNPLEEGELRRAVLAMAKSIGFPLEGIYVMDGSKRSKKTNAFFTGFGKSRRIALFDTLIAKHTVEELVGVLAHEIGHYKRKHIIRMTAAGILETGLTFFLLSIFISRPELSSAFYMQHVSVYAGLIFFGMLYAPLGFVLSSLTQILSRKHEFEADRFAVETTRKPADMIEALKKLSLDNLSHLTPHPLYVWLNYSHPPVLERISAIRAFERSGA